MAGEKDSIKRHWNSLYMQEMRRQLKKKQKHLGSLHRKVKNRKIKKRSQQS
jgi:hypothetical protein